MRVLLLLLVFALTITDAKEGRTQYTPDGFNGYPWGTSFQSMDSLTLGTPEAPSESGAAGILWFKSRINAVGDCAVDSVKMSFLDGDLSSILASGRGPDLFRCLYGMMTSTWGKPARPNADSEMYRFETPQTEGWLIYSHEKGLVVVTLHEATASEFRRYAKRRAAR
ncbi:MAG: hypothetical protein ACE15D_16445 [Candidatus Eisenbacteria bacterium]